MKYDVLEPRISEQRMIVPGVRWLIRDGERVLQERWEVRSYTGNSCDGIRCEWRDIPIVVADPQ